MEINTNTKFKFYELNFFEKSRRIILLYLEKKTIEKKISYLLDYTSALIIQ